MKEAAEYLHCSVSGLRKLIDRSKRRQRGHAVKGPTIMFQQPYPGADIRFRRNWLVQYIEKTTCRPEVAPLKTRLMPPANLEKKPWPVATAIASVGSGNGFSDTFFKV
jgi:hypothetical protein